MVVGTSAGSLIGALYAAGMTAAEFERAGQYLGSNPMRDWIFPGLGLFGGKGIRRFRHRKHRCAHDRIAPRPICGRGNGSSNRANGGLLAAFGFATLLGGAIGNIIDRAHHGAVVDWLDFHVVGWHRPAFNVADIGITVGAAALILDGILVAPRRSDAEGAPKQR